MSTDPIDPPVSEPPVSELPAPAEVAETLHFDFPRSNIVLRSCDSHDFHVSRLYIVLSSPVLREIMRNVSSTSEVADAEEPEPLPVVELPENGVTLHSLLTLIFPVVPIIPSTSEKIMELVAVAQKYQMDSVLDHIRSIIGARKDPPFIHPETAFRVYFLAQKLGLHQEAVQAARVTLRLPMVIEDLGDKLEFSDMTGAYLYELWKYHERVRNELKSGVPEFRNSGLPERVKGLFCTIYHTASVGPSSFPQWLGNYIESIAGAPHLFDLIEFEDAWARHVKEIQTSYNRTCSCVDISSQLRRAFWEALTAVVDGAIKKVDSTLALVREEATPEISDPSFVSLRLNVPDASIIIRSSDQVSFRVHKSLLAMSSPFFEDMLSLPQPPDDETVDGLPVVQLSEGAGVLNCLVSLLFPISPIIPGTYQKVFALLAACQKYDMVSIQSYIRAEIQRGTYPAPVATEAFSAYAIASSLGLVLEAENAARLTVGQPLTFESLGEGLRSFKGQALSELVRYRALNNSASQGRRRGNRR